MARAGVHHGRDQHRARADEPDPRAGARWVPRPHRLHRGDPPPAAVRPLPRGRERRRNCAAAHADALRVSQRRDAEVVRVRVLALDTSTPHTSCALLEDDRVVRERSFEPPAKAGDVLPLALGDLEGIDAVAVGLGPGSFTGLRVGLAAAKSIAYARRLPIAGASSLQAIAMDEPGLVYAATEARKGELFLQPFRDGTAQGDVAVSMEADVRLPEGARLV